MVAQENIGINQDNFAPVNSRFLNPSTIVDAGTWLDINIIGFSAYARTNFVFMPDVYLPSPSTYKDPVLKQPISSLYAYSSDMVLGPSVSLVLKKQSFAIHTAVRSYLFSKKLPPETIGFVEDSNTLIIPDGNYESERIRMKEMTWEEYGFTYGRILKRKDNNMFTGAVTISRLYGLHVAGMYMRSAELQVSSSEGSFVNIEEGNYWYNEPARLSGKGWSGSFGFTFKKMKKDISNYIPHSVFGNCKVATYKYKIGVSLLDVGLIRFNQNALTGTFDEDTPVDSMKNWTEVTQKAIEEGQTNDFQAWLPAALSIQYDHNFNNFVYGNVSLINRVTFPSWRGAERANMLSVSLRFETKKFSAALPLTLHEYTYPQLGLSLRLWFFTIGTDQLIPFIRRMDVYSADVYMYFKIPIFISPECRTRKFNDKNPKGHYKKVLCPAWQ